MTLIRQPLLIQRVSPFVGRCQKTREGLTAHNPCGDAVIGWAEGDRERMWRAGQTGHRGISSPLLQQLLAEPLLSVFRQVPTRAGRALIPLRPSINTGSRSRSGRCKQLLKSVETQIGFKGCASVSQQERGSAS